LRIPLSYNIRNLAVRRTTTVMTALGIGLTVAVLAAALALTAGLEDAFRSSGHPLQLVLLRKGGGSELTSQVSRESFNEVIRFRAGIGKDRSGEPLASPELIVVINLPSRDAPEGMNVTTRGMLPVGRAMREETRIVQGRWFGFGKREVVVGADIAARYPDAQIGRRLSFGRGEWEVVGIFRSDYPARNSEVWADGNQMLADFERGSFFSSVLVRAQDEVARQALINDFSAEKRLQLDVLPEVDYFAKQTSSGDLIRFVGTAVALIMAIGSCFAAMNTMYAAVARRAKEIGTLRVLGFSRGSILASFFAESIFLALLGGALGILLVLPLSGFTTGIGSDLTFAEVAFRLKVTPRVAASGMVFALLMGALGGLLPAFGAARKEILNALREG
jgi:putative ABC transport system permease protein